MKDLEKIKSPDLACQVQDANPGNFAIEQEVGAMVGATVPAPSAPSDDDARELGAQLLVFLRRALLPIQTALRTAVAAIYAHLDSRCTDYTPAAYAPYQDPSTVPPYDPMRPLTPRTLPNLLTAITAFSARKISAVGVPDGISLVHLLCGANNVTEITDDNYGWAMTKQFPWSLFPSLRKIQVGCSTANMTQSYIQNDSVEEIEFSNLESIIINAYNSGANNDFVRIGGIVKMPKLKTFVGQQGGTIGYPGSKVTKFIADEVESISVSYTPIFCNECYYLQEFIAPKLRTLTGGSWNEQRNLGNASSRTDDALVKVVVGYGSAFSHANYLMNHPNLIDVEIRQGASASFTLAGWNPTNVLADADKTATFLHNFLEHICQRLANRTGQTKLTLTLSAAVYTAIMTDKYIKAELLARNWKVTDGSNNYNN